MYVVSWHGLSYFDGETSGRVWETYVRPPSRVGESVTPWRSTAPFVPVFVARAWAYQANPGTVRIAESFSELTQRPARVLQATHQHLANLV